jgi:nucleoside-diphosphate-sugar epimerase
LRIGNVIEPHEYEQDFPKYMADPSLRKRIAWSYIDARDLGQIVMRCIETDGLGYQVFNAGQRSRLVEPAEPRTRRALLPECPVHPRDRRVRGALLQPQDQGRPSDFPRSTIGAIT